MGQEQISIFDIILLDHLHGTLLLLHLVVLALLVRGQVQHPVEEGLIIYETQVREAFIDAELSEDVLIESFLVFVLVEDVLVPSLPDQAVELPAVSEELLAYGVSAVVSFLLFAFLFLLLSEFLDPFGDDLGLKEGFPGRQPVLHRSDLVWSEPFELLASEGDGPLEEVTLYFKLSHLPP